MPENTVETKSAIITRIDEDTLKVVLKPDVTLPIEEYNSFEGIYREMTGGKEKFKLLVILQRGANVEKKKIDYFKKDYKTSYKKAEAYLVSSPISRMFIKVLAKVVNNKYPIRVFETESAALKWLAEQK